ncbi:MAG TPA: hypothetical protein VGR19_09760 [Allosphingosinicella sp.]|nr:hypothetical protein [Allosphingosinicella sp.]
MGDGQGSATRGFHNRIAVVFDFDRTLSAGTVDALLDRIGLDDKDGWREQRLQPMIEEGWDEILAKAHLLARTAEEQGCALTRDLVEEVGRGLESYPGVEETLDELRKTGAEAGEGAEVELYVLSSGFVDIMAQAPVARCFDGVWGSSLHWSDEGELLGVKRTVIHSEKARYLLAFAKGLDIVGANEPQDVHQDLPSAKWHVPLDQMIYVGDGASDIDAFKLMHENGGVAIAVDHSDGGEKWQASDHMFSSAHVENLAPPDFTRGEEMHRSLMLAAEMLGKRVALRSLGVGE